MPTTIDDVVNAANAQTAAFLQHVQLIEGAGQAALDASAAKTSAEADALSIAGTKTTVDGQAAAIAQAIADINTAIDPRLQYSNLIRDGGRFVDGQDGPYAWLVSSAFTLDYSNVAAFNGSTIQEAGKFIHDNSDNGGAGGALAQPVIDLMAAQGRTGNELRFGPEFYVIEITAGSGVAGDFFGHYPMMVVRDYANIGIGRVLSGAAWIRLTAGTGYVRTFQDQIYINGVGEGLDYRQLQIVDGWMHVAAMFRTGLGYNTIHIPAIYGVAGTKIEMALPVQLPIEYPVPVHTQPLAGRGVSL